MQLLFGIGSSFDATVVNIREHFSSPTRDEWQMIVCWSSMLLQERDISARFGTKTGYHQRQRKQCVLPMHASSTHGESDPSYGP